MRTHLGYFRGFANGIAISIAFAAVTLLTMWAGRHAAARRWRGVRTPHFIDGVRPPDAVALAARPVSDTTCHPPRLAGELVLDGVSERW